MGHRLLERWSRQKVVLVAVAQPEPGGAVRQALTLKSGELEAPATRTLITLTSLVAAVALHILGVEAKAADRVREDPEPDSPAASEAEAAQVTPTTRAGQAEMASSRWTVSSDGGRHANRND